MDESSGYNQIRMTFSYEEMTIFKTTKGIYCYKVMSFNLKNVGATYQRVMQKTCDDIWYVDELVLFSNLYYICLPREL